MADKIDFINPEPQEGISLSGGIRMAKPEQTPAQKKSVPEENAATQQAENRLPGSEVYLDTLDTDEAPSVSAQQAKPKTEHTKWSKKDRTVISVLATLNLLVFAFIGIFLMFTDGGDAYEDIKVEASFNPATDYFNTAGIFSGLSAYVKDVDYPAGMREEYYNLYSENTDTVGWLRIPGTSIDGPVVRGQSNEEYERTDFYKQKDDRTRLFFMDFRNTVGFGSQSLSNVSIIYGHHLTADECIFAEIEDYMDVEYYKTHPIIEMNTLYGDYQWKVFACFVSTVNREDDAGNLFYYWNPYLKTEETAAFAAECQSRSYFTNPAVTVQNGDKLLLLSTCTYIFNRDKYINARCVLCARLVRSGEKTEVDVSEAVANPNRRMPQIYYNLAGLSNPFAGTPVFRSVVE